MVTFRFLLRNTCGAVLILLLGCSTASRQASLNEVNKDEAKKPNSVANKYELVVGDVAPTFKLKSLDRTSETDLADFKGKKPVVLIFGSYT